MYVCMYVCMYVHLYVYVYVYVDVDVDVYIYMYKYMYVCACMYVCMCATCMYAWPCRILYGLSLNSTARLQKVIRSSTPESDYEGLNRQPFKTLDLWVPFKGSLEGSPLI